jgi:hypothetical protein
MSMSRGCMVVEAEPGQWWCVVAYREYDYDFRSGEKFGPASTAEAAFRMMRASNPGSSETIPFSQVDDFHRGVLSRMDVSA